MEEEIKNLIEGAYPGAKFSIAITVCEKEVCLTVEHIIDVANSSKNSKDKEAEFTTVKKTQIY